MAKGKNARDPVTARGVELLKLIQAAGFLMLTEAEGAEIVAAGQAVVDPATQEGDAYKVTLTEAGLAAIKAAEGFTVRADIPVPVIKRGGKRGSKYPFDVLQVGQSFHVPATAELPKPADSLASSITSARRRFMVETGETETVTVKDYQLDENGKRVKGADGKPIVTATRQETRPKMKETRQFVVATVGDADPEGPGARVWRTE